MTKLMQYELEKLKKQLLELAAVVEESVQFSIISLEKIDRSLAEKVIAGDDHIDRMEVALEEECLKILALHQPVAIDLRFIIAVLKINNDLERIGDLASNIAERTLALAGIGRIEPPFDFARMTDRTQQMLNRSLDSLMKQDTGLAQRVLDLDDEVDEMHSDNFRLIKNRIRQAPEELDGVTHYLTVSRHLERIADLATNIAEDVYYMIEGEIVRHICDWPR